MSLDLVAVLLLFAAGFGVLNHRFLRFPPAIGLLIVALAVSAGVIGLDRLVPGAPLARWSQSVLQGADLPHLFLDVVLAYMLFAGSLHVDLAELRSHKWTVLVLATAGTLLATGLYAGGIWILLQHRVPFVWCLVLGAVLAPTDPIAIAGLLRRVGLPPSLAAIIAGESLFNDGVGVVVFGLALKLAQGSMEAFGTQQIGLAFLRESVGGAGLGLATGYIAYRAMRLVDEYNLELTISLALVTVTYSIARQLGVSGPIAVVVAGLLIGNHATRYAMSEVSRRYVTLFWTLIDELLNALLFLLIGFELLSVANSELWVGALLGGIVLAVVVRLVSVAIPGLLLDVPRMQLPRGIAVLTWGGLRGGISVALALSLPPSPWRGGLLIICYSVVVFTIVVQGLTMGWLIRYLYAPADTGRR